MKYIAIKRFNWVDLLAVAFAPLVLEKYGLSGWGMYMVVAVSISVTVYIAWGLGNE